MLKNFYKFFFALQITIVPTYESGTLRYWYSLNEEKLINLNIDLAPAANSNTLSVENNGGQDRTRPISSSSNFTDIFKAMTTVETKIALMKTIHSLMKTISDAHMIFFS